MTVQEKLTKVARKTGFPFAINAHGYNFEKESYDGLQAWACEKDTQGHGVEILVFSSRKDIEWFDSSVRLYAEVEEASFFTVDEELFYF